MSGGVDSTVAAWLLRAQGHEVIGVFMRHGQTGPLETVGGCCSAADAADARRVADRLDIPFYTVDFAADFAGIVEYFVAEYAAGRTPNPCIVCNTRLKFGRLFDFADCLDAEYVATGHYARLIRRPGGDLALCRGRDAAKDQSYVLFGIERRRLPRLMFPVGEHDKAEIRGIARQLELRVAEKRDSQEICFVPDQDHARFIRALRGPDVDTSGEIVTTDGRVVGRHDGFGRFTIGQRKGLRVALGAPRYVVRIEAETRRVVIGTRDELDRSELDATDANWLVDWGVGEGKSGQTDVKSPNLQLVHSPNHPSSNRQSPFPNPAASIRAQVKIRYRSRAADATVCILPQGGFHVCFDEPCQGIAPGQAAVCYDGERVLGGGWIT